MAENSSYQWVPKNRDYDREKKESSLQSLSVFEHPLLETAKPQAKPKDVVVSASSPPALSALAPTKSAPVIDPLSVFADPLRSGNDSSSSPSLTSSLSGSGSASKKNSDVDVSENGLIPWASRKAGILQKYTTDQTLGIQVTFLPVQPPGGSQVDKVDTIKNRLEQLDETVEAQEKETLQLSQKEWIVHIEKLHQDLIRAWNNEERVRSLKIAIQCAKLLSDTNVLPFYPSKFVLVTELLDSFGRLVFDRIRKRSAQSGDAPIANLPESGFKPEDVSAQARETCRNWFFKIASIRELLPRIYIEMSIIKCYSFLARNPFVDVIKRLTSMIRGIGDPLVATYTRCYLSRKGLEVAPQFKDYLYQAFNDHLVTLKSMKDSTTFVASIAEKKIEMTDYHDLYSPAVEWLLDNIVQKATPEILTSLLKRHLESNNGVVLNFVLSSYPTDYIASRARDLSLLIKDAEFIPKWKLYVSFGKVLVSTAPAREDRLGLLNDVWKVVTRFEDQVSYLNVADVWIEYTIKFMSGREVNVLLGDLYRHMKGTQVTDQLQTLLQSIISKAVAHFPDLHLLFSMDHFLPMLDLFSGETQISVNKAILSAFAQTKGPTSDAVTINTIFAIAKTVHDSLNALSFRDEIRQVSSAICSFIHKVDFGRDVEKALNFFSECRRAFGNLDTVKYHLILCVNNLAVKTLKLAGGKHNKRTGAFARACIAYSFITIPALEDEIPRLWLYLLSAQVALLNLSLPQADSLLKAAITLIPEVPPSVEDGIKMVSTEPQLVEFLKAFISSLVVVPGHPEQGAFYLVKGLIKVIRDYPWAKGSTARGVLYCQLLSMFSAYAQVKLPHHIAGVESNDTLFGGTEDYMDELNKIINTIISEILEELASFKEQEMVAQSATLSLELFNYTIAFSELNKKCAILAANLFGLCKKTGKYNNVYLTNSLNALNASKSPAAKELFNKLAA